MTTDLLPCVELNPEKKPSASVIWMHGIGADGHDFTPIVPQLRLPSELPVRFIFPHAPKRPITIHCDMEMRAWFDILDTNWPRSPKNVNVDDINQMADRIAALIQREIDAGIPSERIVLAGFSQGGVIALHTGLRYPKPLAGIMALSTYLPTTATLADEGSPANRNIQILMIHGTIDPMVPLGSAALTYNELKKMGYPIRWREYEMVHTVCPEEILEIRSWLLSILG